MNGKTASMMRNKRRREAPTTTRKDQQQQQEEETVNEEEIGELFEKKNSAEGTRLSSAVDRRPSVHACAVLEFPHFLLITHSYKTKLSSIKMNLFLNKQKLLDFWWNFQLSFLCAELGLNLFASAYNG
jgi:hypothetical protein